MLYLLEEALKQDVWLLSPVMDVREACATRDVPENVRIQDKTAMKGLPEYYKEDVSLTINILHLFLTCEIVALQDFIHGLTAASMQSVVNGHGAR